MKNSVLSFVFVVVLGTVAFGQAQYKVLWSFSGTPNDGSEPLSSLIFDRSGNLYGTTEGGGANMNGAIFKLSPNDDGVWTETILYSFCTLTACVDGAVPTAGLVFDSAGNLYGTTLGGGAYSCQSGIGGCGTVFELSPTSDPGGSWTETVLYSFCADGFKGGCQDGAEPTSQLTIDASGNLYGTTTTGGTGGFSNACCWGGTVFELSRGSGGWTYSVLYNFCANGHNDVCPDGSGPQAGVTFDSTGNLYGTTEGGGYLKNSGNGTVYKLSSGPNGWTETVLSGSNVPIKKGGLPLGGVSLDKLGNVYGTFSFGGANFEGGVFRLNSKNGEFTTLSFNGNNGQTPSAGVLLDSKNATLYGTTRSGGFNHFYGTVFQIVSPAQESVLYNFCSQSNCVDGETPVAGLIADKSGNLYGTASLGGANGQGVVFEIVQQAPKHSVGQAASLRSLLDEKH